MRVLVAGAGGVGGYFGARLARAGVPVTFLARGAHLDAMRRDGLRVRSAVDGEWVGKVDAVADVTGQPPADAILFCVKSFDTETAAAAIRPVVGPDTAVVSLQNGVDSEDTLERVLGPGHAVGGVAYVFSALESPGVIVHRLLGRVVFGELDGRASPRLEHLRQAFDAAGVPAEVAPDIRRLLWQKYLMISAQAGMTALVRAPIGVIRAVPETWRMYRAIVEELAALARGGGVDLGGDAVESVLKVAEGLAPQALSSLHDDLAAGRRLELEALHGHAARLGERLGVPTPMVSAVYAALKPHAAGRT
ncbi:MAG TPA: 2-dehydropantoate 2-reductase [Methylomirabilota bacterium]|nr:2-dehydropantoate 2-reductase [Methylomirabilota bacterium]